jgi:hypothetical protein
LDEKRNKKIKAELCFSPLCQINDFNGNVKQNSIALKSIDLAFTPVQCPQFGRANPQQVL